MQIKSIYWDWYKPHFPVIWIPSTSMDGGCAKDTESVPNPAAGMAMLGTNYLGKP